MPVQIDKISVDDISFEGWENHKNEIFQIEQSVFKSEAWTLSNIEESISMEFFSGEVAVFDGKVVGYFGVNIIAGEGYIANVAVKKSLQKNGVGKILVERMLEICSEKGCEEITLEVRVSNETAICLYEKFGFQIEAERKNFYPDGEACYIMWKRK